MLKGWSRVLKAAVDAGLMVDFKSCEPVVFREMGLGYAMIMVSLKDRAEAMAFVLFPCAFGKQM